MSRDPETSAASSSRTSAPSRRTILTGAAWSVPVIAAASIAPIASASGVTALAFNQSTYNGTACGTITGAYVTVTEGGVPKAGQSVTVTLSGGYTFSGGATTSTGVSDASGKVALPAVIVPAVGGAGSVSAVSGSATANSTTTATAVKGVGLNGRPDIFPALPAGITATSVGLTAGNDPNPLAFFLGSDTYLYQSTNYGPWTKASPAGVQSISIDDIGRSAIYTTGTEVGLNGRPSIFPALPAGITATSVGLTAGNDPNPLAFFLGSDTYLYQSTNNGPWTKASPAGVQSISTDAVGRSAIYTLKSVGC